MVREDGRLVLIDLGLGKSNVQEWKTRTGVVMGSVGYMPPEQARGEHVDACADVYAMGVVAFEMFALRNYIKRGPIPKMMEASMNPKFMKPSEFRPDVPSGLDDVIRKAVQPNKKKRFQSAAEFLKAVREVVPKQHTEGGMEALLEELFGASKRERRREIRGLLAHELPAEAYAGQEATQVFVLADGVLPPDQQPTKYTAGGPEHQPTRATEVTGGPGQRFVNTARVRLEGQGVRGEQGAVVTTHPHEPDPSRISPFYAEQLVAPKQGVTMGQLMGAVLVAAVLGGAFAVFLMTYVKQPQQMVTLPSEAPPPHTRICTLSLAIVAAPYSLGWALTLTLTSWAPHSQPD